MKVTILNKGFNKVTHSTIRTFLLEEFPKCLLSELQTHRIFSQKYSQSAESSRARPVQSVITQIKEKPYIPRFTRAKAGMQGDFVSPEKQSEAEAIYLEAMEACISAAQRLRDIGIHKQDANRITEPWKKISLVITTTHLRNFINLRDSDKAQPALRDFAAEMSRLDVETDPVTMKPGDWFKPWPEFDLVENTARAAATSYDNHGKDKAYSDFLRLHDDLKADRHEAPFEHCAMAISPGMLLGDRHQAYNHFTPHESSKLYDFSKIPVHLGNFNGFLQYRKFIEYGITDLI